MIEQGFDVHHMDGDRANNDPRNLVLIECGDHMRPHCRDWQALSDYHIAMRGEAKADRTIIGAAAYDLRLTGLTWGEITEILIVRYPDKPAGSPHICAKIYADEAGWAWPIQISESVVRSIRANRMALGKAAYDRRFATGLPWRDIWAELSQNPNHYGPGLDWDWRHQNMAGMVRLYALEHGHTWPITHTKDGKMLDILAGRKKRNRASNDRLHEAC